MDLQTPKTVFLCQILSDIGNEILVIDMCPSFKDSYSEKIACHLTNLVEILKKARKLMLQNGEAAIADRMKDDIKIYSKYAADLKNGVGVSFDALMWNLEVLGTDENYLEQISQIM